MPNFFVKSFRHYDLDAQIRGWMVSVTRVALLQERIGTQGRFLVCRYENIVNDTAGTMTALCERTGVPYHPILLKPTIAGHPWAGNSHQGKQDGVNRGLAEYYREVLTSDEISSIEKATGPVREYLNECRQTPADLTSMPRKYLYDYDYQNRYIDDEEKISLYYALVTGGRRRVMVKAPDITAVAAYFYSKIIRLVHIPRLLKLKLFPGLGRQNYT
jgi:hypothetical protein